MISEFQGECRWLSNFAPVKIILDGIEYPTVEHAYMSAKSDEPIWKEICSHPNVSIKDIKKWNRQIDLKPEWNSIKLDIMRNCLEQKYSQEPYRTKLMQTGNENIQEGNYWGDEFWGINLKKNPNYGENHLGRLIMEIRSRIR